MPFIGKITQSEVTDGSITSSKLANDSVAAAKIADDAVVQAGVADESIDEARMQISNAGTNGQFLSKQSGNTGGLTWATAGIDGWSSSSNNLLPASASSGIYLGVNSATSANLLDDYEEGTWTPTLLGSSSHPSITTSVAAGKFVRNRFLKDPFCFIKNSIMPFPWSICFFI